MTATAQSTLTPRFVRKTSLQAHERNTNFIMLDNEITAAVTSEEADRVTPLMSKIYLRLKTAPREFFEREGVLRFAGEEREGKWTTAWEQLRQYLRVSSETANKALSWMHEQGIIGYSAHKNGVGIRIFLNRAASSIGFRPDSGEQKILRFPHVSAGASPTSVSETPFKDKTSENDLDQDNKSVAPKNGADEKTVDKISPEPVTTAPVSSQQTPAREAREATHFRILSEEFPLGELVAHITRALEPKLLAAATSAARREHERTREWLDKQGIPKATRVAQREAYNVLRKSGMISDAESRRRADLQVGRAAETHIQTESHPRTEQEITDIAETCVALLEVQGKSIEVTLSEISTEGGGWLLADDAPKVRERAHALISARSERRMTP